MPFLSSLAPKLIAKNGVWVPGNPFSLYVGSRQYRAPMFRQCIYQLFIFNTFISLFSNNKFLNSLRILRSILFPNLWKLMLCYFGLLYYIFKSLKIYCCKLWTAPSYFWTCLESIFKPYKTYYFSINTGFLTNYTYIHTYIHIHTHTDIYIYIYNENKDDSTYKRCVI